MINFKNNRYICAKIYYKAIIRQVGHRILDLQYRHLKLPKI